MLILHETPIEFLGDNAFMGILYLKKILITKKFKKLNDDIDCHKVVHKMLNNSTDTYTIEFFLGAVMMLLNEVGEDNHDELKGRSIRTNKEDRVWGENRNKWILCEESKDRLKRLEEIDAVTNFNIMSKMYNVLLAFESSISMGIKVDDSTRKLLYAILDYKINIILENEFYKEFFEYYEKNYEEWEWAIGPIKNFQ